MAWQALIPLITTAVEQASSKGAAPAQVMSSPVDRRMETLGSDPTNTLKQGRAALDQVDSQTREGLAPVIDEAIKKSAQQKQKASEF
jgi:hypothetical protein